MKTHQSLITSVVLSLSVGMAGAAFAVVSPPSSPATRVVSLTGTADGFPAGPSSAPEVVDLTGNARITTIPYAGDNTSPPGVLVDIEILNVKGKGRITQQPYVGSGKDRSILSMPLSSAEHVEIDFLFYPAAHASLTDRSKVNHTPSHGSFNLTLDTVGAFKGVAADPLVTPHYR